VERELDLSDNLVHKPITYSYIHVYTTEESTWETAEAVDGQGAIEKRLTTF